MVVSVAGVTKVYGEGVARVVALDAVDLEIDAGELTALAGPSGSGKTTLLNMVGCLDRPTAGRVTVVGQELSALSDDGLAHLRAAHIGFVFQSFNLVPVLSAVENVEVALHLSGKGYDDVRDRALAALISVGLEGMEHRRPNQLSGGQQQRVAIARALVKEPSLVIADEPTANLDSTTGAEVLDLIRGMNERQGITFVVSSHDPMVLERARRVVELRDGAIVGETRP